MSRHRKDANTAFPSYGVERWYRVSTLGDWYAEHQLTVVNGEPKWMRWQRQALSIVFDGVRLGDHPTPPDDDRYCENKLWEQDGCARALVAARLESQIVAITTIPESQNSTPDFVADLRDGRKIAIEHTRVTSEEDQLLRKRFNRVAARITELVAETGVPPGRVSFTFQAAPEFAQTERVAREMLRAMTDARGARSRRVVLDASYPALHALGVDVADLEQLATPEAIVRPSPVIEVDAHAVAATAVTNVAKKRAKVKAYGAYGEAVWLTVWVDVRFCLPTTVLRYVKDAALAREPFEQIVVACSTSSVILDAEGVRRQTVEP